MHFNVLVVSRSDVVLPIIVTKNQNSKQETMTILVENSTWYSLVAVWPASATLSFPLCHNPSRKITMWLKTWMFVHSTYSDNFQQTATFLVCLVFPVFFFHVNKKNHYWNIDLKWMLRGWSLWCLDMKIATKKYSVCSGSSKTMIFDE